MSYLKDHHFTLEDCHEVPRFFPHCNSDLDWLAAVFLVQGHRLERRGRHFILRRMSPLKKVFISPRANFFEKKKQKNSEPFHLPAKCRAGKTFYYSPGKCRGRGSSLLRRSIRTIQDPPGPAPDSQSSTPERFTVEGQTCMSAAQRCIM